MEDFKFNSDDSPCFSQIFHKELMNCIQTFRTYHLTTKSIFTSIISPEIIYFLLGHSSSISSTLDEDNEGVWETENVSLLVESLAIAVGTTTLILYRYSNCHFLIQYLQLRNKFQYLFTLFKSCLLTLKKPFLYFTCLCSFFNLCKSSP